MNLTVKTPNDVQGYRIAVDALPQDAPRPTTSDASVAVLACRSEHETRLPSGELQSSSLTCDECGEPLRVVRRDDTVVVDARSGTPGAWLVYPDEPSFLADWEWTDINGV